MMKGFHLSDEKFFIVVESITTFFSMNVGLNYIEAIEQFVKLVEVCVIPREISLLCIIKVEKVEYSQTRARECEY